MFGGLISILIAIWIYRTAVEAKTGNMVYWVVGSVIVFLSLQLVMTFFNAMIVESFDRDLGASYDAAGGLNMRDNSDTAGLQSGSGGTLIGIIFEFIPLVVPFFAIAVIRQILMLKQSFSFKGLFGGIKEMFSGIINSFKTT